MWGNSKQNVSPLSFDIYGMPIHPLNLGPCISTLVTLSKHSLNTDDRLPKYVSVIVDVPAACVIDKGRYPSLSVDVCVVTLTQSGDLDGLFVGDLNGLIVGALLELFV
jgi:hypothetical protein